MQQLWPMEMWSADHMFLNLTDWTARATRLLAACACFTILAHSKALANNTWPVKLDGCCTLQLSDGWKVYQSTTKTYFTPAEASERTISLPAAISFSTGDDKLVMNIFLKPRPVAETASQQSIRDASKSGLEAFGYRIQKELASDPLNSIFRKKYFDFQPTKRIETAGRVFLWTVYKVQYRSGSVDQVQVYQYVDGPASFDMTFTYELDMVDTMQDVIRKIVIDPK